MKENKTNGQDGVNGAGPGQMIQQRLVSIMESSDDAIFVVNLEFKIETWNPGAERLYGFTPEEAVGSSVSMLIPENGEEEAKHILDKIRRGEYVRNFQTVRLRKDCELVHISLTVSPVKDDMGTVVGASVIARDMTEMVCMEKKLEESERFALSTFDALTAHIAILDENSTIMTVNKAWRDFALPIPPSRGMSARVQITLPPAM
jgi:PAS domain S-box-containing protein